MKTNTSRDGKSTSRGSIAIHPRGSNEGPIVDGCQHIDPILQFPIANLDRFEDHRYEDVSTQLEAWSGMEIFLALCSRRYSCYR